MNLDSDRINSFSPSQRKAVAGLLDHLALAMPSEIQDNIDGDALDRVRQRLQHPTPSKPV